MPIEVFANAASTTLSAAISVAGSTSFTVASGAKFPVVSVAAGTQFRVIIDNELYVVTDSTTTTWTVTPAAEGTIAATHLINAPVTAIVTGAALATKVTSAQAAAAAPVQSVAGRTGAVVLTSADVSGVPTTLASVFDANAAPYNCVSNNSAVDNAAGFTAAIAAAVAYAKANNGVAAVEADDGEYYIKGPLLTTNGCYAQITIPDNVFGAMPLTIDLRSKSRVPNPLPYLTPSKGGVVLRSTLTAQVYSNTLGWPSILGARDTAQGVAPGSNGTASVWMHIRISWATRQLPNPSLAGVNFTNIIRQTWDGYRADTTESYNTTTNAYTAATNPTGVGNLTSANNNEGILYQGFNYVTGHYGGLSVGELTEVSGVLFPLANYIGINVQTPDYHLINLGRATITRCAYGLASINPTTGLAAPTGIVNTGKTIIKGTLDLEDSIAGYTGWNKTINHIYDPNNALGGRVEYIRVISGSGNVTGALTNNGATNLTQIDLTATPAAAVVVLNRMRLNQATFDASPIAATDWAPASSTVTIAQSSAAVVTGAGSMLLTSIVSGDTGAATPLSGGGVLPASGGTTYTAVASFRPFSTVRAVNVQMYFLGPATSVIGTDVTETAGTFVQAYVTGVAPTGTTGVIVYVIMKATVNTEQHYVDNAGLFVGTSTVWSSP